MYVNVCTDFNVSMLYLVVNFVWKGRRFSTRNLTTTIFFFSVVTFSEIYCNLTLKY
jgi:hypothetical protein